MSLADIAFLDVFDRLTTEQKINFNDFSELAGHFEKIKNTPTIKKWMESRPVTQC